MKRIILTLSLLNTIAIARSQVINFDSLKTLLACEINPQTKFRYLNNLAGAYMYSLPDSSIGYIRQEIALAKELNSDSSLAIGLIQYGVIQDLTGNLPQAFYYGFESLKVAERSKNFLPVAIAYYYLSSFYMAAGDYDRSVWYCSKAKKLFELNIDSSLSNFKNPHRMSVFMLPEFRYVSILLRLASTYEKLNILDSALFYAQKVKDLYPKLSAETEWPAIPYVFANIYARKGNYNEALNYYRTGMAVAQKIKLYKDVMDNCNGMANVFRKIGMEDSSIYYTMKVIDASRYAQYSFRKLDALEILAETYRSKNNADSAVKYFGLLISAKDSLFSRQKVMQMQALTFNEDQRHQEIEKEREKFRNQVKVYGLTGGLAAFLVLAGILWRNSRQKQKANLLGVRNRLHRDLHDDIGATLSSVKTYSEILKDNPDNPVIAELIRDNSAEMLERLEIIAWATSPQHDNFKSLKNLMIKFAAPLCHSKNIQCNIESNGVNDEMLMTGELRQNIFLVFKEAINNMIKYAEATDYKLQMSVRDRHIILKMADNGKGSDGTIQGNGEGWKNMKKRTEQLNGKLIIDSSPGKGTVVTMQLPYPFKAHGLQAAKQNGSSV